MRKPPLFSAMLILFLLVPASITWAQTVSVTGNVYEKNTVKNTFKTPHGNITAILPDDMADGDMISGTVVYEPGGTNQKKKRDNLEQMLRYTLSLGNGTVLQADINHDGLSDLISEGNRSMFRLTIPSNSDQSSLQLFLKDAGNKIVGESRPPLMDKSILMRHRYLDIGTVEGRMITPQIEMDKTIYLSGENAAISLPPVLGKIILEDHIISFVQFSMAGQKPGPPGIALLPLVSSPRRMVVQIPSNVYGQGEINLKDKNKKVIASQKIHVLKLEASCPKTSLLKNEKTLLNVTVNGLKDCPADYIRLNLDNVTSASVQLGQSNHEELVVKLISKTNTRLNEDSVADIITRISWDNKSQDENKNAIKKRNVEDAEQYKNDKLSLQRSVTALQSGSFTINIGLSYPSSVYNEPFRQQLDALKTVEQFNNWQDALKADSSGEHIPDGMIEICRRLSSINSPAELDEAKARAYNFISWPRIGQEVVVDFIDATIEAGKAAVQNAIDNAGTAAVNIEMIQSSLRSAGRKADITGNTELKDAAGNLLKEGMLRLQQAISSESERVQILNNIRKVLNDASKAAVNNIRESAGRNNDGPPIQFEQKELKEPRKLEDKALQIGLHGGIKKLIADAAGARGQTWNTVCDNCRGCIEARMGEWAADLVKDLGVGIIKEYLGAAVGLIGEAVKAVGAAKEFFDKISDKADKAEKLADDIADKIQKGELKVMALEAKLCVKSSYCLIKGTIFYNPKTGCVFAIIYCEGGKLCCPNSQTIITMTYCTDDKGMPTQVPDIDVIKK